MKTCVGSVVDESGVIEFTHVKISDGIHNTDSIRNSGIFTCENPGLYLISVYITTDTIYTRYNVYKIPFGSLLAVHHLLVFLKQHL